jgi:phosphate-selective porin OprO and OprP
MSTEPQGTRDGRVDRRILRAVFLSVVMLACASPRLCAQDSKIATDTTPKKRDWNEWDVGFTTIRLGMAAIHEYAAYRQDAAAKAQMDSAGVVLENAWKFRDFRFFANGRLRSKRPIVWKIAGMYDGVNEAWTFRETGFLIGIPEWHSELFIGRSKEGYSLIKVQNGYSTWVNERQMWLDNIPIMTDGIRWYGYLPTSRFLWSIGAFTDAIYEGVHEDTRFAPWDYTFSGRVGWRPIYEGGKSGEVVHLGINARYAKPDDGKYRVRSRPESNPAPYFIDTGEFESDRSTAVGAEAYYRKGPLMAGTEINQLSFQSAQAGDPRYWGGDFVVAYTPTGETRPYLSNNSVFFFVDPDRPLIRGGPGGFELVLRYSWLDLNDGALPGGMFWKITPSVNWYVDKTLRIELVYGYGKLDRFNLKGATQFIQTRLQLQIM